MDLPTLTPLRRGHQLMWRGYATLALFTMYNREIKPSSND